MSENIDISELMERLHRIHRQLNELKFRLDKGSKVISFQKATRKKLSEKLNELKEDHCEFLLDVKEKEMLLKSGEDNVKRRRSQLEAAKNNKEYQSLKEQIETDEATNNRLTDDVLEAMGIVEESATKIKQAEEEIAEIDRKIESLQNDFNNNQPKIESDIVTLTSKLAASENELPRDFRGIYARLKNNLGGEEALAPITDGFYCGHCNRQVPTPFIADICNGKPIICQACGRLLYTPEGFIFR
ncbi:MAG: hypothetical protein Q4C95_03870 [Planctomycetia bacterium]|nr:hypothetical protein [Planctomycetia bacterium]